MAKLLKANDIISFSGVLGAGKTCLIKGIADGLGIWDDMVKSPSYTLINEYDGKIPLYHFDLYRMKDSSELYNIGWDDYLMRDGIVVVEWGERAEDQMPDNKIDISIEIISETKRRMQISF
ncbi:MAG: tRNA (adenosine(37)-N6)-threonylcarbamoyltransferase complex ATPase subunit type 1 TsaE [candidate division Zixibacteria bacterium]|nr:tRNA (adenosine(37)-N6)-threonylcarbamoyltransferase complex ATPase subunit type 1 TsaE [candidate division Zixibacteria bacterium]